jgi:hypothetical protein
MKRSGRVLDMQQLVAKRNKLNASVEFSSSMNLEENVEGLTLTLGFVWNDTMQSQGASVRDSASASGAKSTRMPSTTEKALEPAQQHTKLAKEMSAVTRNADSLSLSPTSICAHFDAL